MNQKEYVEGCLAYYDEQGLIPGNPDDGVWDEAHYPVPACLGGTETVTLLREHHAVQGVLQSEECGHPCVYGWEHPYLTEELLQTLRKWLTLKGQRAMENRWGNKTYEERSQEAVERLSRLTPEQRAEWGNKIRNARTPEEFKEAAVRGKKTMTPEARSEAVRKGWLTRKANQAARSS